MNKFRRPKRGLNRVIGGETGSRGNPRQVRRTGDYEGMETTGGTKMMEIWMILGAALGAVIGMFIYAEGILLENERLRGILRVEVAAREVLEAWMDAAYRSRKGGGKC